MRFGGLVTSLAGRFMVQVGSMQQRGHKLRPLRNLNHDNRPQAGLTPVPEFPLVLWAFLQLDIRGNFQNTSPTLLPPSSTACAAESPQPAAIYPTIASAQRLVHDQATALLTATTNRFRQPPRPRINRISPP